MSEIPRERAVVMLLELEDGQPARWTEDERTSVAWICRSLLSARDASDKWQACARSISLCRADELTAATTPEQVQSISASSACVVLEDRDRLRSQLASLHTRLRALADDLGAVQTDDPVEDVRRVVEGMAGIVAAMHTLDREWKEVSRDGDSVVVRYPLSVWHATLEQADAARRLAAAREKGRKA